MYKDAERSQSQGSGAVKSLAGFMAVLCSCIGSPGSEMLLEVAAGAVEVAKRIFRQRLELAWKQVSGSMPPVRVIFALDNAYVEHVMTSSKYRQSTLDHTTQVSKLESCKFLAQSVAFQARDGQLRDLFTSLAPALTRNLEGVGSNHVIGVVGHKGPKALADRKALEEVVAALQLHFLVDYKLNTGWSARRYLEVMQRRGVERQELLADILDRAGPHGLAHGCHLEELDERMTLLLQGQQSLVQLLYWLLQRFRSAPEQLQVIEEENSFMSTILEELRLHPAPLTTFLALADDDFQGACIAKGSKVVLKATRRCRKGLSCPFQGHGACPMRGFSMELMRQILRAFKENA